LTRLLPLTHVWPSPAQWRRPTDDEEDRVAVEVPDSWGLTGKVAVVTGGGAAGDGIGNGRAAAILLARAGAQQTTP
jgi:hypothetical protein